MIKEVPSKVFNKAVDKWLLRSMGIVKDDSCSYCKYFEEECYKCPLRGRTKDTCCDEYWLWDESLTYLADEKKAKYYAKKLLQRIIDNCVYEVKK